MLYLQVPTACPGSFTVAVMDTYFDSIFYQTFLLNTLSCSYNNFIINVAWWFHRKRLSIWQPGFFSQENRLQHRKRVTWPSTSDTTVRNVVGTHKKQFVIVCITGGKWELYQFKSPNVLCTSFCQSMWHVLWKIR